MNHITLTKIHSNGNSVSKTIPNIAKNVSVVERDIALTIRDIPECAIALNGIIIYGGIVAPGLINKVLKRPVKEVKQWKE